jgi:acyl-CoA thioesterase FadM
VNAAAGAFILPITIRPDDIDELGHVNNGVYLR